MPRAVSWISRARPIRGFRAAWRRSTAEARGVVTQVNGLLEQAAELAALGTNSEGNQNFAAQTRLSQVLDELAGLINFTLIHQSDGTLSIVAGGGEALVVGTTVRPLRVGLSDDGISIYDEDGRDVTAGLQNDGGELGAILELRNETLPGYLDQINRLAKSVVDQVNEQHARGVDITGAPGRRSSTIRRPSSTDPVERPARLVQRHRLHRLT